MKSGYNFIESPLRGAVTQEAFFRLPGRMTDEHIASAEPDRSIARNKIFIAADQRNLARFTGRTARETDSAGIPGQIPHCPAGRKPSVGKRDQGDKGVLADHGVPLNACERKAGGVVIGDPSILTTSLSWRLRATMWLPT